MDVDQFEGIPDSYDGRVIIRRHQAVTSMPTVTPGNDVYVCNFPTPGVAYWWAQRGAGATTTMAFTPVYYSDFLTMFPAGQEASVVSAFRYASNVIEIIPTVNQMSWSGAIEVWKSSSMHSMPPTLVGYELTGFDALNSVRPATVMPFNHGLYCCTRQSSPIYEFNEIVVGATPATITTVGDGVNYTFGGANNFTGFGSQEWCVVKFPAYAVANTAIIRSWACIEYKVSSTSAFFEFARSSPPEDRLALQLLNEFMNSHPCAVAYYENGTFWQEFLKWTKTITGALKVVPGPVGEIAGIANLVAKTIDMYI